MDKLFIAHSVFLTPEERRLLGKQPQTIETVGISVPANTKDLDNSLTEVFVRYFITTELSNKSIELMSDGYKIEFPHYTEMKSILSFEDGGSSWLLLEMDNEIEKNGTKIPIHHQIVFKDVSDQERTTVCNHLGQFLNKKK